MRTLSSAFLILVMGFTLVACGGSNSGDENVVPDNKEATSDNENAVKPDNTVDEPEVTDPVEPVTDGKLAATIEIELEVEGNVEKRIGTLALSDNGYHLYTLPNFKFTPEEPNADQVYLDKYEDYYMRIITLGAEPELTEIRANAEEELAMLGEVVEMKGDKISNPELRDSVFYLRSTDSTLSKYIIVRKIEDSYFKIILNLPVGEALDGAGPSFSAMIKTIQPSKP